MLNPYFLIPISLTILVGGWLLAKHETGVVTILSQIALAAMAVTFCVMVITGMQHESWGDTHRLSSYLLLFLVWSWGFFSLGAVWWRHWPKFWPLLGRTGLLLVCIGLTLLAGFSGYLGPTHAVGAGVETHNRFIVLHYFVCPLLLCLSIGLLCRWEWQRQK